MKRPTIADIARRAGVSKGAVSYALNGQPGVSEATRRRVLAIAGWGAGLSNFGLATWHGAEFVGLGLNNLPAHAHSFGVPAHMHTVPGLSGGAARPSGRRRNHPTWGGGGATGGGFETALGYWGDWRVSGSIKGFWAALEDDHNTRCRSNCLVTDPTGGFAGTSGPLNTITDREADYWGGSAELKFATGAPTEVRPDVYRNDYFIAGFDVRGIDQDNRLRSKTGTVFNYNETLDTTYTGGYIGFGGEYSFGFVPVIGKMLKGTGGFYDRLGLRTYLNATAGIYNAETDYTGRFTSGGFGSRISQSSDEVAFIGTVSLETRKQLGTRTSLSLWTDYEFISSVPKMEYAAGNSPTRIDDESVFASRTMLRLNIGLGSQQLYTDTGY